MKIVEIETFEIHPPLQAWNEDVHRLYQGSTWEEWLGMEIEPATLLAAFDEVEVLAHCLWEMTFAGFDQEDIQQQIRGLRETVDENEEIVVVPQSQI